MSHEDGSQMRAFPSGLIALIFSNFSANNLSKVFIAKLTIMINMPQKYRKLTRIKKNTDKFYSNSSFSSESVIQ
jgi:hypothetical protein